MAKLIIVYASGIGTTKAMAEAIEISGLRWESRRGGLQRSSKAFQGGNTFETPCPPEKCPICKAPGSMFKKID